jgi:hypothetical protein
MRTTSERVLTTSPTATLEDIIPLLNKVTGIPVLAQDGRVMGVISRKVSWSAKSKDEEFPADFRTARYCARFPQFPSLVSPRVFAFFKHPYEATSLILKCIILPLLNNFRISSK